MGENHLGAVHIRLDRAHRARDDKLHPHRGRQVHHDVRLIDELCDHVMVRGGVDRVLEARMVLEVADVLHRTRGEVIQHVHSVAVLDQQIAQMRADETGAAGDEEPHFRASHPPGARRRLSGEANTASQQGDQRAVDAGRAAGTQAKHAWRDADGLAVGLAVA